MKNPPKLSDWHRNAISSNAHIVARCVTCKTPKLAEACREFAEQRKGGSPLSWAYFHRNYVMGVLDIRCISLDTMMKHVRRCMGGTP